jgi:hypothetical protein
MILSGKSSRQDHAEEDGFAKVDTVNQTSNFIINQIKVVLIFKSLFTECISYTPQTPDMYIVFHNNLWGKLK